MLVTVGSGVSVMKVNSPTDFERVGGTALGGGSFWGLCKLLTNIGDFDELMEIIKGGDPTKTDLLVGDIYGGNYNAIGLNATTTASLFAVQSTLAKHILLSFSLLFIFVSPPTSALASCSTPRRWITSLQSFPLKLQHQHTGSFLFFSKPHVFSSEQTQTV